MKKIIRKTMLYKTGVEYGDYTINHVIGCSHGCKYPCYAYMMAHRFGNAKNIEEWCDFQICENAIEIINEELEKMHNKIKSVQLCFSTDPFMYEQPEISEISIKIIKTINKYNIPCFILTKGILPKKLIELNKINYYGITYVSNKEEFRENFEPYASPLSKRLESLKFLHENGCKTWVSMEPYPTPNIVNQNLDEILNEVSFVDKIVFGRLNYNKLVLEYKNYKKYYNDCVLKVISFCESNDINYHIKDGTLTNTD